MSGPAAQARHFYQQLLAELEKDDIVSVAAALAFWTLLSLAPMAILLVLVASKIGEGAQQQLIDQVGLLAGSQARTALGQLMANAAKPGAGRAAGWISLPASLLSATAVFVHLQAAMNRIWGVKVVPGGRVRGFLYVRFKSVLMMALLGLVLAASLLTGAAVSLLVHALSWSPAVRYAEMAGSLTVLTCAFSAIYKVVPDVEISWRDVVIGAFVTSILFTLGKVLIGLYLSHSVVGSLYGTAGSVVLLLLWIYYSILAFLLGAEITQVGTRQFGRGLRPGRRARRRHEGAAEDETRSL